MIIYNRFLSVKIFFSNLGKYLSALFLFSSIFLTSAHSFYVKLGNSLSYTEGIKGNITHLDMGFLKIQDVHLGLSLQQGFYNYKGFYKPFEALQEIGEYEDFHDFYDDFFKVESLRSRSNIFFTLMYKPEKFRGFYVMGGVGAGLVIKSHRALKDVANLLDISLGIEDIVDLLDDPNFQEVLEDLADSTSDLADDLYEAFPELGPIVDQIDTPEDIAEILKNEESLNQFVDDVNDFYDKYANENTEDDWNPQMLCNALVECSPGFAYTIGVGYDKQIWGPIGLDIKADIQQVVNTKPAYSIGASIIIRPSIKN